MVFLNEDLDGKIYMGQPEGSIVPRKEKKFVNWLNHCMSWSKHQSNCMKNLITLWLSIV